MFWDSYGALLRDDGTYPGNSGDSCNETGNFWSIVNPKALREGWNLADFVPTEVSPSASLNIFRTPSGYVRHPDSPWREDDFSSDQATPLLAAAHIWGKKDLVSEMLERIQERTGNGDLISPVYWALRRRVEEKPFLAASDAVLLASVYALVYVPFRWNDEKKAIERTNKYEGSTDWKVLFCVLWHAEFTTPTWVSKKALRTLVKHGFLEQMKAYYAKESPWIIRLYELCLKRLGE